MKRNEVSARSPSSLCGNGFTQIIGAKLLRISEIKTGKSSSEKLRYLIAPPTHTHATTHTQAPLPLLSPTPLFLLSAGHLVVPCHIRLPSCRVSAALELVCLSDLPNNLRLCRRRRLISSFLGALSCRVSQLQARRGEKKKNASTHTR